MAKKNKDALDNWWVILDPDGGHLEGDGASSNLSVFTSKENAERWAAEMADGNDEENMYRVLPVKVELLDEPKKKQKKRTQR